MPPVTLRTFVNPCWSSHWLICMLRTPWWHRHTVSFSLSSSEPIWALQDSNLRQERQEAAAGSEQRPAGRGQRAGASEQRAAAGGQERAGRGKWKGPSRQRGPRSVTLQLQFLPAALGTQALAANTCTRRHRGGPGAHLLSGSSWKWGRRASSSSRSSRTSTYCAARAPRVQQPRVSMQVRRRDGGEAAVRGRAQSGPVVACGGLWCRPYHHSPAHV